MTGQTGEKFDLRGVITDFSISTILAKKNMLNNAEDITRYAEPKSHLWGTLCRLIRRRLHKFP
jgi:hypothetical protein